MESKHLKINKQVYLQQTTVIRGSRKQLQYLLSYVLLPQEKTKEGIAESGTVGKTFNILNLKSDLVSLVITGNKNK